MQYNQLMYIVLHGGRLPFYITTHSKDTQYNL